MVYFCFQTSQLHKLVEYLSQALPTVDIFCQEKVSRYQKYYSGVFFKCCN